MKRLAIVALACGLSAAMHTARAADWPTYRHDIARSGVTPEALVPPLKAAWVYRSRHAPCPAWPPPVASRPSRTAYEHAYQVAVVDGAVYFGSSADDTVYCLDAGTGRVRWRVFTGGPVRVAPTVWRARVYVGSDDGWVYCLDARDGRTRWKRRAASDPRRVLGGGRMVSPWPVRTGVLVDGGIAYFAAGLFPTESVFIRAVRAEDGRPVWQNDTCGQLYVSLPHGGAEGFSGLAPQGPLLASRDRLYVPNGRSVPAALDRKDGRLVFWKSSTHWKGGAYALLSGDMLLGGTTRMNAYDAQTGTDMFACYPGRRLVVTPERSYLLSAKSLAAVDRGAHARLARHERALTAKRQSAHSRHWVANKKLVEIRKKRKPDAKPTPEEQKLAAQVTLHAAERQRLDGEIKRVRKDQLACATWQCPAPGAYSLILAGGALYAGGKGRVSAVDAATGKALWSAPVDGKAYGLAVAGGRLLVSTDTGAIHCFGQPSGASPTATTQPPPVPKTSPYPTDRRSPVYAAAAEAIVKQTGITRGYGLVLGCDTGRLACELAKRTELHIIGIEQDASRVDAARRALDRAGLYGTRVSITCGSPDRLPFADYFANLVVSDRVLVEGAPYGSAKELYRVLKPLGGTAVVGQPTGAEAVCKRADASALHRWLAGVADAKPQTSTRGGVWVRVTRGALPGAGQWTHQYADASNSGCSTDTRVRCPLGLLWFGRPGPAKMLSRHMRPAGPLSVGGRLFVQGDQVVMAIDAYNGVRLWQRKIKGARRLKVGADASNLAATRDSLFVATGEQCLRLDVATGQTRATYTVPPAPDGTKRGWGWVACHDGLLLGSARHPNRPTGAYRYDWGYKIKPAKHFHGDAVFAVNLDGPRAGQARWTYRGTMIPHSAIALGGGRVFLVDGEQVLPHKPDRQDARLVALDAASGKVCWQRTVALPEAVPYSWDRMRGRALIYARGTLVIGGCFGGTGLLGVNAADGHTRWSVKEKHVWRPLVIGDTVIAGPYAYDLRTGKQRTRRHPMTGQDVPWQMARAYGCGTLSACPNAILFRSGSVGMYDLKTDGGTSNWGGMRPGCWINAIAAAGLVLIPEGSAWCVCSYPIQTTVALAPVRRHEQWSVFTSAGPTTPVAHLAVNLGAPGDRRADDGALWFAYPRPPTRMGVKFRLGQTVLKGMGWFRRNADHTRLGGTDKPWIYASGCRGLTRCSLPLVGKGQAPGVYTVRLGFCDPDNDQRGVRVFDVKLQGQVVAQGLDVVGTAGARDAVVVKVFAGIRVANALTVELVSKHADPSARQAPVLNSIEVVRQDPRP